MRVAEISPLDTIYTDKSGHDVIVVLTTEKLYTGRGFGNPSPGGKKIMAIVATDAYARNKENLHAEMIADVSKVIIPNGDIVESSMTIPAGTFLAFMPPSQIAGDWYTVNERVRAARQKLNEDHLNRRKAEDDRMNRAKEASSLIAQLIPGQISRIGTHPQGFATIDLGTLEAILELAKKGQK